MTAVLCAGCLMGIAFGASSSWPWWTFVPLSVGAVFFFVADTEDE